MNNWPLNPLDWIKKKEVRPEGFVGISCSDAGVALAHGVAVDGSFKLTQCEFISVDPSMQLNQVKDWVKRNGFGNSDCHYILSEDDYELQLIERPQVQESELREAIRWRLKDLIELPIEEVALDIFLLPDDAYRGRMSMLYAVVANKKAVKKVLSFIKKSGLSPCVISIPEMALRNIALHIPEMELGTVALLKMQEVSGTMLMYSHESLYLTRDIEFGYSSFSKQEGAFSLDNDVMIDRLSLDIQRSLDYYESQLGKGVTNKIYILPMEDERVHFSDDLQNKLQTSLLHFDCREFLPFFEGVSPSVIEQAYCWPAIGAVLRRPANVTE